MFKNPLSDKTPISARKITLTEREKEVARALLKHFDEKLVARELGISKRSVGYHSENIRKKMEEKKTASAVTKAYKQGLI